MVLLSYLSYSLSVVEICLLSILLQRHKKKGVMEIMLICQNKNYVDIHNLVFAQPQHYQKFTSLHRYVD